MSSSLCRCTFCVVGEYSASSARQMDSMHGILIGYVVSFDHIKRKGRDSHRKREKEGAFKWDSRRKISLLLYYYREYSLEHLFFIQNHSTIMDAIGCFAFPQAPLGHHELFGRDACRHLGLGLRWLRNGNGTWHTTKCLHMRHFCFAHNRLAILQ